MRTFVLDTSVLLYHEDSIHGFPGQEIILPMEVLEELDKFKTRDDSKGNAARYLNRFLDELRSKGSLTDGVTLDNGQIVKVSLDSDLDLLPESFEKTNDNRIISVAVALKKAGKDITVVSRDINFRVKCDSLRINAENYIKEKAKINRKGAYTGVTVLELEAGEMEDFYTDGFLKPFNMPTLYPNEFVVLKFAQQSALGVYKNGRINKLKNVSQKGSSVQGITPKNKEQIFAMEALLDKDVHLMSITGISGSGKTLLSVAAAVDMLQKRQYDKIIIARPAQSMSNDVGFLPGTLEEKLGPWLQPIKDNFKFVYKNEHHFNTMLENGTIEMQALSHIRGRTLPNTIFILDEAQNITYHEAKAVLTRMGENSKLIALGDIEQIDAPHLDTATSGLTAIVEKFKDFELSSHITLLKGERSPLATYAAKVL